MGKISIARAAKKLKGNKKALDALFNYQESIKPKGDMGNKMQDGGKVTDKMYFDYYTKVMGKSVSMADLYKFRKNIIKEVNAYKKEQGEKESILNYSPDIPKEENVKDEFNTKKIVKKRSKQLNKKNKLFKSAQTKDFPIPEEKYVDDIPFDTKAIAESSGEYKDYAADKGFKNSNVIGGAIQGAGMIADYFNKRDAINRLEEPSKIALAPRAKLNKNMDTSSYVADVNRQFRTQNMIAGQNPNTGVGNAVRGNVLSNYMQGRGQINTAASNYKNQVQNQESQLNASIDMRNAGMLNDLYAAQSNHRLQKQGALALNESGLYTNAQLMAKDFRQQKFDLEKYDMLSQVYHKNSRGFANSIWGNR